MAAPDTTWISVVATLITVIGTVVVASFNRQNRPLKDILKKTRIEGNGSLTEALGVLQRQLKDEQIRYDKQINDSQIRHQQEIAYYVEQLRIAREEIQILRHEKDIQIAALRRQLADHETRLNQGHVGTGK